LPCGDQEYFGDGIAEEIINAVTGLELLKVASRTSSFQFKGATTDIRKIGENLNVEMILEGSVRAAGKKLRVTAQLINVCDGYHIWSERYDRSMEDVFAIQDEIADSIATALRAQISGKKPSTVRRHTQDVEAYHLYLKGRHCWNKRHQGVLPKAIEYFNEAIDQDPTYALAYSGLADAYNVLAFYGFEPPDRGFRRAKAAAVKALEIDPGLPEAYASLGYVSHHHDWDWSETESNYKRALELRGGYAVAHQWYAIYLASMGRSDEAIGSVKRARELDPLSPVINTAVGWVHYLAGMNNRALCELETAFDLDPDFPWLRYVLGQVHQELSRLDEAVSHFEAAARITNQSPFYLAGLSHCLARTGDTERAQEIRGQLERISMVSYVSAMEMALLHAGTKDEEALFGCLDNAFEERSATLPYIAVDPRFRFAKGHPRLIGLFGRMNLDS
jgi:TolB-like protein/tetratricopeptide (TPR) repeat protein